MLVASDFDKADIILAAATCGEEAGMLDCEPAWPEHWLAFQGARYLVVAEPVISRRLHRRKGVLWVKIRASGEPATAMP